MTRLDDFVAMGAENLWVFDPSDRSVATYSALGLKLFEGPRLKITNSPIYLDVADIFSTLD